MGIRLFPLAPHRITRVGEGDQGPNTGGMGAYSPAPVMTPEMDKRVMNEIIPPTLSALKAMGMPIKAYCLPAYYHQNRALPYRIQCSILAIRSARS